VREVAHAPSLDQMPAPSPLTSLPEGEGNSSGWSARLNLCFEPREVNGTIRTVMTERNHFGPLRILKALYPEGDAICHAVIVHPPGGIVAGDSLAVDLRVNNGAHTLSTTPGAQKWYRSTGARASAITRLHIADHANLEWMPQETIAFNGARAEQTLEIALAPNARFFGWEMLCLGRTTRGERFASGEFRQRIRLVRAGSGAPMWRESMRLMGDDPLMNSPLGFRGMPVAATAWIALPDDESGTTAAAVLAAVRGALGEAPLAAASSPEPGLVVVKALGDAPEAVRNLLIGVWKKIRLQVFAVDAVLPRIWST
jgi:urease accessory protein